MNILKEVSKNVNVAINAIDDIIGNVENSCLRKTILGQKESLLKLNREISESIGDTPSVNDGTAPNAFEKTMMKMATKMKSGLDKSNTNISEMLIEGYNMGINDIVRVSHEIEIEPHPYVGKMISLYDNSIRDLRQFL